MYVDASALVAILANEPERSDFINQINRSASPSTSATSVFESMMALKSLTGSCTAALSEVMRLIETAKIEMMPIGREILSELALVRDRYGKGSGHPAGLNMGDCFSYAMAKHAGVRLLYKGNDFALTDLA